jgi:hypothetical protein
MSYHRVVSVVLMPATLLYLSGCASARWVGHDKIRPEGETVEKIVTVDGDSVTFSWHKGWGTTRSDSVFGYVNQQPYEIELVDVSAARVKRTDAGKTILLSVFLLGLAAAAAVGIAAATWDGPLSGYGGY